GRLTPRPLQGIEGAAHVGVIGNPDVDYGAGPPAVVVGEVGQLPVGHHAQGAALHPHGGDAEPDALHRAHVATHLDDVAHAHETLEQHEEPRDDVFDEGLGAEAHGEAKHAGENEDGAHVHADVVQDDHGHRER